MFKKIKELLKKVFTAELMAKLFTSALISIGGMLIIVIPMLINEVTDFLRSGAEIDWITPAIAALGAVGAWVVATVRQVVKILQKNVESNKR